MTWGPGGIYSSDGNAGGWPDGESHTLDSAESSRKKKKRKPLNSAFCYKTEHDAKRGANRTWRSQHPRGVNVAEAKNSCQDYMDPKNDHWGRRPGRGQNARSRGAWKRGYKQSCIRDWWGGGGVSKKFGAKKRRDKQMIQLHKKNRGPYGSQKKRTRKKKGGGKPLVPIKDGGLNSKRTLGTAGSNQKMAQDREAEIETRNNTRKKGRGGKAAFSR